MKRVFLILLCLTGCVHDRPSMVPLFKFHIEGPPDRLCISGLSVKKCLEQEATVETKIARKVIDYLKGKS